MAHQQQPRPQNVGIKAMEIYFPNQCVEQSALEKFDGVSEGKYTIGLGQTRMSFCDDREDIYSLALTTVSSLLRKYNIPPTSIGRLEVGTETILDKSKSVKSVLMQLFTPSGNTNIEGVDTVNACYGGTNALFNTLGWFSSPAWHADGCRNAIVVAGDIALYSKGAARPTGGAGCVAMLIGPDAPLVVEEGLRGTYMKHVYDFYKPDLTSEYPVVDGHYSVRCYAEAMDACYKDYNTKETRIASFSSSSNTNGSSTNGTTTTPHHPTLETPLDRFTHMAFHSPTCKVVTKNYARLLYNDYLASPTSPFFTSNPLPAPLATLSYADSLTSRELEKHFLTLSAKRFIARVKASTLVPTQCGNMYCASVYSSLISIICTADPATLDPTASPAARIGVFSYGSGLASSLFSLRVVGSLDQMREKINLLPRLAARRVVAPEVYDEMCEMRKRAHLRKEFAPEGKTDALEKGTWYLTGVDGMWRRTYGVVE